MNSLQYIISHVDAVSHLSVSALILPIELLLLYIIQYATILISYYTRI